MYSEYRKYSSTIWIHPDEKSFVFVMSRIQCKKEKKNFEIQDQF